MKRFVIANLLLALMLAACAPAATASATLPLPPATQVSTAVPVPTTLPATQTLTVFADTSLGNAFAQMGANVQAGHPGLVVNIHFGDAQSLRKQIEQGEQADVFASADQAEMDTLIAGKFVDAQTASVFLVNQLVVILPATNPANISSLQELSKPGIRLVLAANESTLGKYSQQVLDKLDKVFGAGYKDGVLKNVISYEQDASQVLESVRLGKADAGFVYASDLAAPPQLQSIKIPSESNVIPKYLLAALTKTANPDLAHIFIEYVLSSRGEAVLQKWGFMQDR